MSRLTDLYELSHQSPWVDNLSRAWLKSGRIEELRDLGVRGLTSNPTIFANAISSSADYDEQYYRLIKELDPRTAYWEMASDDVAAAADILLPVYSSSEGNDGFVSIEVDPELAHDTQLTVEAAQWLWEKISRPNLMIKIPATLEGIPAITEVLARGISVNVTLIFGLERYRKVMDAHVSGIHAAHSSGHDISKISSVASFFVSRVDTNVDPLLEKLGGKAAGLLGRSAVAQAQAAYLLHKERYRRNDWRELESSGAGVQRPLWASTSTKNPGYADLLYVDNLVAPGTVNTMPESTLKAFLDHGDVRDRTAEFIELSGQVLEQLKGVGIDLEDVALTLEKEGVDAFASSFRGLLEALEKKAGLR